MIDHVSLRVADFARSKGFYESALAPLGYKTIMSGVVPGGVNGAMVAVHV